MVRIHPGLPINKTMVMNMIKYGQCVRIKNISHFLYGKQGIVYRVNGDDISVLIDKEVIFLFKASDLFILSNSSINCGENR